LTKELLAFFPSRPKYEIGSHDKHGVNLIKEIVEDFVFPASRLMLQLRSTGELSASVGCVFNMKHLVTMLSDMCYSENDEPLLEWSYLPIVGPGPLKCFVGLKNAEASFYMNSVLQQLYIVEGIRIGFLAPEGAAADLNQDF